jgi:hypothetical protein
MTGRRRGTACANVTGGRRRRRGSRHLLLENGLTALAQRWRRGLMDPTVDAMLIVYAAALGRHRQHLEYGCDRGAWHVLARHLIERAVWSATSTEEAVRDGRPLPWNPNVFNPHDH